MLARSGSYTVRSRVIDDDQHVWLDFEWGQLLISILPYQLTSRIQARQGVVDGLDGNGVTPYETLIVFTISFLCIYASRVFSARCKVRMLWTNAMDKANVVPPLKGGNLKRFMDGIVLIDSRY